MLPCWCGGGGGDEPHEHSTSTPELAHASRHLDDLLNKSKHCAKQIRLCRTTSTENDPGSELINQNETIPQRFWLRATDQERCTLITNAATVSARQRELNARHTDTKRRNDCGSCGSSVRCEGKPSSTFTECSAKGTRAARSPGWARLIPALLGTADVTARTLKALFRSPADRVTPRADAGSGSENVVFRDDFASRTRTATT